MSVQNETKMPIPPSPMFPKRPVTPNFGTKCKDNALDLKDFMDSSLVVHDQV